MPVPCAPLLKLFDGQLGAVHLGRLMEGEDAGRFVLLRELGAPETNLVAAEIERARGIAHPRLAKLLCLGRADANTYLVSEYVPGVALTELRSALRRQQTSLPPAVAVRIALDGLRAAGAARDLLRSVAGIDTTVPFHPDSIWLAEYGEVLATPVPCGALSARTPYSSSASNTPIGLLMELATGLPPAKLLAKGLATQLPEPLARALAGALSAHARGQVDIEALLLSALAALPPQLIATEAELAAELERVVGPRLESRRLLLSAEQRHADDPREDEATVVTRLMLVERTPAGDEPTHVYERARGRDFDPDARTELLSSRPPAAGTASEPLPPALARLPSSLAPAAALLAPTTASGAEPTPSTRRPTALWVAALIAAAALAAAAINLR